MSRDLVKVGSAKGAEKEQVIVKAQSSEKKIIKEERIMNMSNAAEE